MRVLIDIAEMRGGGAERQVAQLAVGLVQRGHPCALAVNKSFTAYTEKLASGGVRVRSFRRMHRFDARILPDLVSFTREFRPDVILSVAFTATLWGRLAAIIERHPSVTAEHSSTDRYPLRIVLCNKLLARHTRATVACADAQVPTLVAAGNSRQPIVVINNGVDTSEFFPDVAAAAEFRLEAGIPTDALVVGLVAAHRREKRHDRFIRLIEGLNDRGLDIWGCMVGAGPLLEVNRQRALRSPARGRLVATGAVKNMRAAYCGLDLVVLVSDDIETFPLCFLEAQACGRAVVGMDTGAVRETFVPGRTGILVRQGDEAAMIGELAALLEDPQKRTTMGDAGRGWVGAHLSIDRMVDKYAALLQSVANEAGPRSGRRGGSAWGRDTR